MSAIFISGLINIETTVQIESFPLVYTPVRYPFFGISCTVSGVGYNVAKALATLGDTVHFVSLIGHDPPGELVAHALAADGISSDFVLPDLEQTPDALFSAFVHFYQASGAPYEALRRALIFASYKVGAAGAAQGFLDATALEALHTAMAPTLTRP